MFRNLMAVAVVSLSGGCLYADAGTDSEGEAAAVTEPLVGGNAGTKTGLVGRFESPYGTCSGVFVPTGSVARWFITAAHCMDSEPYDPTASVVRTQGGTPYGVDGIYFHPQGEWGLTGFDLGNGDADGTGRVDMILVHLTSSVPIAAADTPLYFSTTNAAITTYQESFKRDGSNAYSWVQASISPHSTWPTRANNTANTEPGDSGGPVWSKASIDAGGRLYQGLHSSSLVTDSSSFYEWAIDGIDCGVFDITNPNSAFCSTACPCGVGEGDCDSSAECKPGLSCRSNMGPTVGLGPSYDVCLEVTRSSSSTEGYCESIGGCQLYEGDCDTHAGCKDNLVCRKDVGAAVGLPSTADVCDMPRTPTWRGVNRKMSGERVSESSGWCTTASPCALGEGDCDESDDSTCRGYLRCKANVGNQFGFTNNAVDVCVHPDYY